MTTLPGADRVWFTISAIYEADRGLPSDFDTDADPAIAPSPGQPPPLAASLGQPPPLAPRARPAPTDLGAPTLAQQSFPHVTALGFDPE